MADQSKEDAPKEEQLQAALLPATFIDSFWLTIWQGHIRFTFGENLVGKTWYRSGIVMEIEDAEALAKDITTLVARFKSRAKESKK